MVKMRRSPRSALHRLAGWARRKAVTALGYRAVEVRRRSGLPAPLCGSADRHMHHLQRDQLIRISHEYMRDNGIYIGMVKRFLDNVYGNGFTLQARCGRASVNDTIEKELWPEFCEDPEVRGLSEWWEIERLVGYGILVAGDIGAIKVIKGKNTGRIQLIEAPLIASTLEHSNTYRDGERVEQGVVVDSYGRPTGFMIADYGPGGFAVMKHMARRVEAEDFIFVCRRERPTQTRGVPASTGAFPFLEMTHDIATEEAKAWQMQSRYALAIYGDQAAEQAFGESEDDEDLDEDHELPPRVQEVEGAIIFNGSRNERMESVARNIPGNNFSDSMTMYLRLIGLPLGCPLEMTLLDWSKTNYSSARAALEQYYQVVAGVQRLIRNKFHASVYRWKVRQWVAEGRLPNLPDVTKHDWIMPRFPWVDPAKEADAWQKRIEGGFATLTQADGSLNQDRDAQLEVRAREIAAAIEKANELNEQYPDANVRWEVLAGLTRLVKPNGEPIHEEEEEDQKDAPSRPKLTAVA